MKITSCMNDRYFIDKTINILKKILCEKIVSNIKFFKSDNYLTNHLDTYITNRTYS